MIIKDKIHFSIIRAGHICKQHKTMIQRNPKTELVAFFDIRSADYTVIASFEVPLLVHPMTYIQSTLLKY